MMYVVMDDSIHQMCYFKRLRKPRIAEKRTAAVLRNKAERPRVQSNCIVCLVSSGEDGLAAAATVWLKRGWDFLLTSARALRRAAYGCTAG